MKTNQQGYTALELIIVVGFGGAAIALTGGVLWVAIHFISKFW